MYLPGAEEWLRVGRKINGADVFSTGNRKVSEEWLSNCKEERVLTKDLMEEIADPLNLAAALRQVVSNRGSSGIDNMSTEELKTWFTKNCRKLSWSLRHGQYIPTAVGEVRIPKPKGGYRILGIPTVKDRLVQQAISQVMSNRYERVFSSYSYGFRPGISAHDGLKQASKYIEEGRNWIIDMDLEKFFDKVDHDRLLWLLGTRIGDKRLLKLINRFLKAGMMKEGLVSQRIQGTPQGSPLSPLLSNIVLDELDKELESRGHRFVRYADDLIIMVNSELSAHRVLGRIIGFIEGRLKLKVNRKKSRISRPHELNFLGHSFGKDGKLLLSRPSEERFKEKLREITKRSRGISLKQLVEEVNAKLRGWLNYFKYAWMQKRLVKMEGWLNRRIRCFRLKQCKRAIGIARFLYKLGVTWNRCWTTAGSSKGWFRLSSTHAAHEGMNTRWLRKIGLFSLLKHYMLHLKETAQYERRTLGGVRGR